MIRKYCPPVLRMFTVLLALFTGLPAHSRVTIPPAESVLKAKEATVLVDVEEADGLSEGSAFCVDANGLFVTNAHVVEDLKSGGMLTLVLHSGEKNQTKLSAHVLIIDKDADLAILQADKAPANLQALSLGNISNLIETMSVVAFGYPFGSELALKAGEFPSITVSTGHITSLHKTNGVLVEIQLDASLNPGNSGGPIVDDKGDVIAIVKEGIPGSGINFAIPVSNLRALIDRTHILFKPPVVEKGQWVVPQEFKITLNTPVAGTGKVTMELTLSADPSDKRSYPATSTDGRNFVATAPLLAAKKGGSNVELTIQSKTGPIIARAVDRKIKIGNSIASLSQISRIDNGSDPHVTLTDNLVIYGAISGLSGIDVELGGAKATLNLSDYASILIAPPAPPEAVNYSIQAMLGDKLLGSISGTIALVGAASAGATAGPVNKGVGGLEMLVSCLDSNDVRRYDAYNGRYLGTFAIGNGLKGPQDMLFGPDGNLYVSNAFSNSVRRFNGKTGQFIDAFVPDGNSGLNNAHGMTWGRDGNLYVCSLWSKEIKCFNGQTGAFISNFVAGGVGGLDRPTGLRFGPDGNLYVSSSGNNLIKRYNGKTGAFIDDFAGGNGLNGAGVIEWGPDGNLYVCSCSSNEVKKFNGKTGEFMSNFIKAGTLETPLCITFSPDGKVYVGDKSSHVKRYNGRTGEFIDTFCGGDGMVYPMRIIYRKK